MQVAKEYTHCYVMWAGYTVDRYSLGWPVGWEDLSVNAMTEVMTSLAIVDVALRH